MTTRAGRSVLALLFALALGAQQARSQNPTPKPKNPHRSGLWGEVGGGPARIRIGCGGCDTVTTATGGGSYFRIGGTISRKVLMGLEWYGFRDDAFGFSAGDSSVVAENGTLSAIVMWYPWRSHFYIKGGVGLAEGRFTVQPDSGAPAVADGLGVGINFGLGLDVPISRKFAFTTYVGSFITAVGDLALPGQTIDDVIPTSYMISIGLVFR